MNMMHLNHGKYFLNIIGKQGGNYSQKKIFSIDNEIIDNSEKIANEFNNFFVSICHNLAKYITCNVNPLIYVNSVNNNNIMIMIVLMFNMYLLLK